jgi:aspartate 1-decarboxylase
MEAAFVGGVAPTYDPVALGRLRVPYDIAPAMQLSLLKAKIHRATVTHSELNYEGSVAIDGLLLDTSGIREFEQVHVWDITNGSRFTTYALRADEGSGIISLNGGAARHVQVGDLVIIAAFVGVSEQEAAAFKTTLVYADVDNRMTHTNHSIPKQAA